MSSFTDEPEHNSEMQDNRALLGELPLFSRFPNKALKLLAFLAQRATYHKGEVVFEKGDDFGRLLLVVEGSLQLVKKSGTAQTAVQQYKEKDHLGSFSLLGPLPSLFTLEAEEKSTVLIITREQFVKILEQFPDANRHVVHYFLSELYQWERRNLTRAATCCLESSGATVL